MKENHNKIKVKYLGINTQHEHFAYIREDSHVCVSEGFEALTRIRISKGSKSIVANLNVVNSDILLPGEIGLSESAIQSLKLKDGDSVTVSHLQPINSLS